MTLRDHLQAIYDTHGVLTPELVVREARAKNHPLHTHVFDRAPREAAEAWYRHRAHDLIQSVKVVYKSAEVEHSVRAFHAVRTESGHVYESIEKIANDPFLTEMLLRDAEREWKALHARYGHIREFLEIVGKTIAEAA